MRKYILIAITLVSIIALTACANEQKNTTQQETILTEEPIMNAVYQTITPANAKDLIGGEGVVLVDVRTREEFTEKRIPGAVLLPLGNIAEKAQSVLPDKDSVIIIYCRSGRRSKIAAEELINMGYKNVYDLGGIIDWSYETVSG